MDIIAEIQEKVEKLLGGDTSGHGMTHVKNVLNLSQKFAREEGADLRKASIIALLHDADDHKLFGEENAKNLTNTRRIMQEANLDDETQAHVITSLGEIGYSKRLKGIVPTSLEAKIVSDADMCEGLGTSGILRTYAYSQKHSRPFFNKKIFPIENISSDKYLSHDRETTGICHFFEKILRLKDLMLTDSGKTEAENRHEIVVDFLYHFFDENSAPEWVEYLEQYLKTNERNPWL